MRWSCGPSVVQNGCSVSSNLPRPKSKPIFSATHRDSFRCASTGNALPNVSFVGFAFSRTKASRTIGTRSRRRDSKTIRICSESAPSSYWSIRLSYLVRPTVCRIDASSRRNRTISSRHGLNNEKSFLAFASTQTCCPTDVANAVALTSDSGS